MVKQSQIPATQQSDVAEPRHGEQGFTLIELMIVMIVIGLLAAIAIPSYVNNIRNAKEAVLKEDLHTLRGAIDAYTVDKQKAPQTLDDLVQSDVLSSLDQTQSGINDVHSGAQLSAQDGTAYSSW